MRLIVLVLANDNAEYNEMQNLWRLYMNKHNYIRSFFIKYKEDLIEDIVINDDVILIKGRETVIPGCLDKTVRSIEHLLKNMEFDFILRTNMSSVFDFKKVYGLLNEKLTYAGFIGYYNKNQNKYVSGAGILLNKETCLYVTNNKHMLNYNIVDDVAIGELLEKNKNIIITPVTRFEVYKYKDNLGLITEDSITDFHHFRCKSHGTPNTTIEIMKKVIGLIYK
jgi:hypothetical protein